MNDPVSVARRYAESRPGFELIASEEVGIPQFRLRLDALVQREKPIGPIDEFVLNGIGLGVADVDGLTGLLGLDRRVVEQSVVDLCSTDHLDYRVSSQSRTLHLTPFGEKALLTCVELVPDRVELTIGFDRLTWKADSRNENDLIRPRDSAAMGLIELPPLRKRRLAPDDLDLTEMEKAMRERPNSILHQASLISVRDVSCRRHFLPGVALIFVDHDSGEQQVAIAVDGRLLDSHEAALGEIDGPVRAGLVVDTSALPTEQVPVVSMIPEDLRSRLVDLDRVREIEQQATQAETTIEEATRESRAAVDGADRDVADSQLAGAVTDRDEALRRLEALPIRSLQTYEHRAVLNEALENTSRRLLIISPWVRGDVVDDQFMNKLRWLARQGVDIRIGWGIGRQDSGEQDQRALERLKRLADEHDNVIIKHLGNTHAKILISDDRLVVTSFNWLSFRGTQRRRYRQEEGILIVGEGYVDDQYERYRDQISPG